MEERPKIKIIDDSKLRNNLSQLVKETEQIELSNWAMECTNHILDLSENEKINFEVVKNGFNIIKLWQNNEATIYEIRQAGFKIHAEARKCKTEIAKTILRTAGQAVGVGHMKEHAMVCSDYAIKTVQIAYSNNLKKITEERNWQIQELNKITCN